MADLTPIELRRLETGIDILESPPENIAFQHTSFVRHVCRIKTPAIRESGSGSRERYFYGLWRSPPARRSRPAFAPSPAAGRRRLSARITITAWPSLKLKHLQFTIE